MGIIEDGKGTGFKAKVDSKNRLLVKAYSESIQHATSHSSGQAYQLIGTADLTHGTVTPMHITNNNPSLDMIVTYIRHQVIGSSGGTDFPNVSNYFKISLGGKYLSGGDDAVPINVNTSSGQEPILSAYVNNPTVTGDTKEIDRWYTKGDGDMNSFNKEGAVILGNGGAIDLSYVGDKSSGTIYTRISFIMMARIDS
ncbi:MAG: hypothetical protein KAH05_04575 [Clostridiales bacterium]|nr:hypothetical protein [Clostridiales bacterium]